MRTTVLFTILAVVIWGLAACAGHGSSTSTSSTSSDAKATSCTTCAAAMKSGDGWCEGCNKGFVDGKSTSCKDCVTAHRTGTVCATCSKKK